MNQPEVHVALDPESAARGAAAAVLAELWKHVAARGRASVVLAGGTTPNMLFKSLAAAGPTGAPWNRVDFFFGDERCVPVSSPHSNYALAHRELFEPLGIQAAAVHRIVADGHPAADGAKSYEATLRVHFGSQIPVFDVLLLGVGTDGHTASLFPRDRVLEETRHWVAAPCGRRPVMSPPNGLR